MTEMTEMTEKTTDPYGPRTVPQVPCDLCGHPIRPLEEGLVLWRPATSCARAAIATVHPGCRHAYCQPADGPWLVKQLRDLNVVMHCFGIRDPGSLHDSLARLRRVI